MKLKKLYSALSAITSLLGLGTMLGYFLGNGTSNTPLWVGGILILLGAITLGMAISTKEVTSLPEAPGDDTTPGQFSQ